MFRMQVEGAQGEAEGSDAGGRHSVGVKGVDE